MAVAGRPLVEWSLAAFRGCECVAAVVVAAPPGLDCELGDDVRVVEGGVTRAASAANALAVVETEVVAIHDAARPLVTPALVEALVATLAANPDTAAVIPAAPVADTIKRTAPADRTIPALRPEEGPNAGIVVTATEDRSTLWAAQTPQVFRTEALREALRVDERTRDAATDEAMLVEAAGGIVLIHPSGPENLKVTTRHDLQVAELLLGQR